MVGWSSVRVGVEAKFEGSARTIDSIICRAITAGVVEGGATAGEFYNKPNTWNIYIYKYI